MKEAQFPNTSQPQGRDQAHLADITMSQSVTEEGSDLNSDVSPQPGAELCFKGGGGAHQEF